MRITSATPNNWWNTNWAFRKPLFINSSLVSGNHVDFPLLIDITDARLSITAQNDGDDIVFTDANNFKLSHEIVGYNHTSGHLVAWVKVPQISSAITTLYIYYGNPEASSQEVPENVWDANYVMVLHLDENEGLAHDSTWKKNDGRVRGGVRRGVSGVVDGAYDFYINYLTGYLEVASDAELVGFKEFTSSFWIRLENTWNKQTILSKSEISGDRRSWFLGYQLDVNYYPMIIFNASMDGRSSTDWGALLYTRPDNWFYVTVVWESEMIPKFYINGVRTSTLGSSTISNIHANTVPLYICNSNHPAYLPLDGILDEIRLSNITRSEDWILTEYNNQHNPIGFIRLGEEEAQPSSPIVSEPFPSDLEVVSYDLSELSFSLMDYQGDLMNYTVTTYPTIGNSTGTNVGNGIYSIPVSGLKYYETYQWKIEATDGSNITIKIFTFKLVRPEDDITPPKADAGSDKIVEGGKLFQFNGLNSTDNVRISNYTWTFFDKGIRYLKGDQPTYTFTTPGTYQVTLVVTDPSGNQDSDILMIEVKDVTNPVASAKGDKEAIFVGNTIFFDGSGSKDNINITYYKWDFGDGVIKTGKNVAHIYTETGTYNVTLTVQDAEGNVDTDWIKVTVSPTWESGVYLLLITICFILAVITAVYLVFFGSQRTKRKIYKINE